MQIPAEGPDDSLIADNGRLNPIAIVAAIHSSSAGVAAAALGFAKPA